MRVSGLEAGQASCIGCGVAYRHVGSSQKTRVCQATIAPVSRLSGCSSNVTHCAQGGALMAEVDWEARKKQKAVLTELLTRHLLTLDSIQATGASETPPEVSLPSIRHVCVP